MNIDVHFYVYVIFNIVQNYSFDYDRKRGFTVNANDFLLLPNTNHSELWHANFKHRNKRNLMEPNIDNAYNISILNTLTSQLKELLLTHSSNMQGHKLA